MDVGYLESFHSYMSKRDTKVDWCAAVAKRKEEDSDTTKSEFYDEHADAYDNDMKAYEYTGPLKAAQHLHKCLDGNLDAKILDVGGGTGAVIRELKKLAHYNNADGLDPAGKMLTIGKENGLYNNIFPQCFQLNTGIEHNSYDAVCSSGAFMPGHIKAEAIQEIYDIVKHGGYIVLVIGNGHLDHDVDLKNLRPLITKMSEEGKIEVIEDYLYDGYFTEGFSGRVFVMRKV